MADSGKFPFHSTRIHGAKWPNPRPEPDVAPDFFWPALLFLLSVAVALVCWSAYDALPQARAGREKPLQLALNSPKFNATGPELLHMPELMELAVVANVTSEPPLLPPTVALFPPVEPPHVTAKADLPTVPFGLPAAPVAPPPPVVTPPAPPLPPVDPFPLPPLPPVEAPKVLLPPTPIEVKPVAPEPPVVPQTDNSPLVYRDSTSGDTPMLRNWKSLALFSLTTVFVQVPVPVQAQGGEDAKSLAKQIESLQETIKESFKGVSTDLSKMTGDLKKIREEIDGIKDTSLQFDLRLNDANKKINQIEADLKKIRADIDGIKNRDAGPAPTAPSLDKASLEDIKTKLGSIEQAILKLQPSSTRVAMSAPTGPTVAATGRFLLVNLYNEELLFLVNGKTYRVAPGFSVPVDGIAAGAVTYEVISPTFGSRARNTVNLVPNETFTLTAQFPR